MIRVQSSDIYSIGYYENTLTIKFNSGGVYEYYNVPEQTFINLLNASSHGKYFHKYVKNIYSYRRVN